MSRYAYIPSKWPSEYVDEFLPVLEQFKYHTPVAVGNQMKYNSWRKYARLTTSIDG